MNLSFFNLTSILEEYRSSADLKTQQTTFSTSVFARDEKVLLLKSVIAGVKGNAGRGVISGVAVSSGNVEIKEGTPL